MADAEQAIKFIRKRFPSRENIEALRARAMLADDFEFGEGLDVVIENLYDIRHALYPEGRRNINASRHWPAEMDGR